MFPFTNFANGPIVGHFEPLKMQPIVVERDCLDGSINIPNWGTNPLFR